MRNCSIHPIPAETSQAVERIAVGPRKFEDLKA